MVLIKDLAVLLNIDKSTAMRAINKMPNVTVTKIKVPGTASKMSAIKDKDVAKVKAHFGFDNKITKI